MDDKEQEEYWDEIEASYGHYTDSIPEYYPYKNGPYDQERKGTKVHPYENNFWRYSVGEKHKLLQDGKIGQIRISKESMEQRAVGFRATWKEIRELPEYAP